MVEAGGFRGASLLNRQARRTLGLVAAIAFVLLPIVASCAKNPVTGKREISLVSPDQEKAIGREGYPAVLAEFGLYDLPRLQTYVDSVGQALARVSHQPNLGWTFTVLDDPTVNAFATPGGYIYITRGIMAHLNSEAQLAGVLGHEIGHVTARHGAQQMTQRQFAAIGLGVASILSPTAQRYGGLAQQALGLIFLKYSRDDETQADELGVDYATKAGWDPREIPSTYAMLRRIGERGGQRLPAFLSTHPDPGDREARTTELARNAAAGKTGLLVRSLAYVARMDSVVYGNDPRQGYFDGTHFSHPLLAFQLDFPSGWNVQNARTSVAAQTQDQTAMMALTVEPAGTLSPSEYFAGLRTEGKIRSASGTTETIGGWPAWVGRIGVPADDGSTTTLTAAGIRKSADLFFRFLGRTAQPGDAHDAAIVGSIRSFRALPDAVARAASPARVKIVAVRDGGAFRTVAEQNGPLGASLEDLAILNNVELDDAVRSGERLKLVTPEKR